MQMEVMDGDSGVCYCSEFGAEIHLGKVLEELGLKRWKKNMLRWIPIFRICWISGGMWADSVFWTNNEAESSVELSVFGKNRSKLSTDK